MFQLGRWQEPFDSSRITTTGIWQVFMKIDAIVLRELSMSLIHPFATSFGETRERRVLLVEVRAEGLSGWGECTTGEHPYFNEESTDTAWVTICRNWPPVDGCGGRDWGQVSRDLSWGARQPHGQGCSRECRVGCGSADATNSFVRDVRGIRKRLSAEFRLAFSRRSKSSWRRWERQSPRGTSASS